MSYKNVLTMDSDHQVLSHPPLSSSTSNHNIVHNGPRRYSTSSIPYNPSIRPSDVGLTSNTPIKLRVNSGTGEDMEHHMASSEMGADLEGHRTSFGEVVFTGDDIGEGGTGAVDDVKSSGIDILDIEHINQSLNYVRANNLHSTNASKREKLPPILMYEINCLGESVYTNMTLRELLNYVNQEAQELDEDFYRKALEQQHRLAQTPHQQPDAQANRAEKSHQSGSDQQLQQGNHRSHEVSSSSTYPQSSLHSSTTSIHRNSHIASSTTKAFDTVRELRLRDLRRLDFQFNPNEEKLILIRRHAVLIAMDPIRAVVMARRLILIVPDGADTLLSILDQYMKEWVDEFKQSQQSQTSGNYDNEDDMSHINIQKEKDHYAHSTVTFHNNEDLTIIGSASKQTGSESGYPIHLSHSPIPFEYHAFEALLTTVKVLESQEFAKLNTSVQETLAYFKSGSLLLPVKIQEQMRQQKNDLSMMMNRISASRKVLQELTEDDEEMALMNLSTLMKDPSLYKFPLVPEILGTHDEIEELIESYLFDFNTLETKINYTKSQIQSAEELVSLRLDTSRNDLLIATTALDVLACSIAFGAYITGIFGMNLDNTVTLQERQYSFMVVTVGSFVVVIIVFAIALTYLQHNGILPTRTALMTHMARNHGSGNGGSMANTSHKSNISTHHRREKADKISRIFR